MRFVLHSPGGARADGGGVERAAEREEPGAARDPAAEEHRDREPRRRAGDDGTEVCRPRAEVPDSGRDGGAESKGHVEPQGEFVSSLAWTPCRWRGTRVHFGRLFLIGLSVTKVRDTGLHSSAQLWKT